MADVKAWHIKSLLISSRNHSGNVFAADLKSILTKSKEEKRKVPIVFANIIDMVWISGASSSIKTEVDLKNERMLVAPP